MPVSYVLGDNVVVSSEELNEKISLGSLADYAEALQRDPEATIEFQNGTVSPALRMAGAGALPFEPIGIGKPLSLEILGYYTGELPPSFGKRSMLVGSAVKAIEAYDAQARAVNQIVKEVRDREYKRPSAEADGSPIVLYTPALVPDTTSIDLTLSVDRFQEEWFGYLAALLKTAGGLPVFFVPGPGGAIASTALLAGSIAVDKAGELGKVLFNSKTILEGSLELRFDTPGFEAVMPRTVYVYNSTDKSELEGYKPSLVDGGSPLQHMVMRNDAGEEYTGRAPYIILSLDGRRRDNLADFKARAATSAILEQYVGSQDVGGQVLAILEEAMSLLNDSTFREKALATQARLNVVNAEIEEMERHQVNQEDYKYVKFTKERTNLEARLAAYIGNINNPNFQLA